MYIRLVLYTVEYVSFQSVGACAQVVRFDRRNIRKYRQVKSSPVNELKRNETN